MAKLVFLLLFAFVSNILTQCTVKNAKPHFKKAVYEFTIELMTRLAQEKEMHFIASTLSTWTLLSTTSLGAGDTTLAEMRQVLKLHRVQCLNDKYFQLANSVAVNNETDVVVEKSSAIFIDDKTPILESFKSKINSVTATRLESLPFDNTDIATQRINDFVSQATHEVIDEIVSPSDLKDATLILLDAIFFKGTWKFSFPQENTQVKPFYNEKGAEIGQVNSMYIMENFNFSYMYDLSANVVEIPYGSGARYSMYVFLPDRNVSVYTVINKLKDVNLKSIQRLFDEYGQAEVGVYLPRFKITSYLNNLKELLEDMGLKTMFDKNRAQFPKLSDYPAYVSNFIQKADIEVTEGGTVAAGVTKEGLSVVGGPLGFDFNKPFLFMIIDKKIEVPLFVGAYSKPTQF